MAHADHCHLDLPYHLGTSSSTAQASSTLSPPLRHCFLVLNQFFTSEESKFPTTKTIFNEEIAALGVKVHYKEDGEEIKQDNEYIEENYLLNAYINLNRLGKKLLCQI